MEELLEENNIENTEDISEENNEENTIDQNLNLDFNGLSQRRIQIVLRLKEIAQVFFQRESNHMSLITVTKADISKDLKNCNVYITVLPKTREAEALRFAKRMRTDLRTDIKKQLKIRTIPNVDVKIDRGEKARQSIEKIFREI